MLVITVAFVNGRTLPRVFPITHIMKNLIFFLGAKLSNAAIQSITQIQEILGG